MRVAMTVGVVLLLTCVRASALVDHTALRFERIENTTQVSLSKRSEVHCLALNIYHESRGESLEGQLAVAAVTMNRVRSKRFPDRVCEVVWQPRQFSWTHDGQSDEPRNIRAWKSALRIANATYDIGYLDIVEGATFFHAVYGRAPYWTRSKQLVRRIGQHVFYKS